MTTSTKMEDDLKEKEKKWKITSKKMEDDLKKKWKMTSSTILKNQPNWLCYVFTPHP